MALRALLIGINRYHPDSSVRPLAGCQNDVNAVKKFLLQHYGEQIPGENHLLTLLNEQATRANVIAGFREHLGQSGPGDTLFIYYSGHGAQNITAPEFMPFVTDKKEEGWVLYDSRVPGSYDLADKEIALLLEEVSRGGADIALIADSCHSGSVTRDADDLVGWTSRFIPGSNEPRPLASYLDGAYQKRLAETGILAVPYTRHILFAACDKAEVAWESDEKCGVFTRALLEALEPTGGVLDYGEAFVQACAAIRLITRQQNPQAEAIGGFNPRAGFLGKPVPPGRRKRYEVFTDKEQGTWRVKLGAAQGLASDMNEIVRLDVFADPAGGDSLGTASITQIGVTESYLETGAARLHPLKTYWAEPLTMPHRPFIVYCPAPETAKLIQQALDQRGESSVLLSDKSEGCIIEIRLTDGNLTLHAPGKDPLVHGVLGTDDAALDYLLKVLDHLAHWSRVQKLDNPRTRLPRETVPLGMFLQEGGEWKPLQGDKATLPFSGQRINFRLTAGNQSGQDLYMALVYLNPRFGMSVLWHSTSPVPSGTANLQIFENFFALPANANEELDTLKLVVSTDPLQQTAFSRPDLKPLLIDPRALGTHRSIGLLSEPDWFAHTLTVHILRT